MHRMQVIDTEDVGEMNVYANVDDLNSHGHACRGTEDSTNNQTSQHRGTETQLFLNDYNFQYYS